MNTWSHVRTLHTLNKGAPVPQFMMPSEDMPGLSSKPTDGDCHKYLALAQQY